MANQQFSQKVAGQPCKFCGAVLINNPKTGKVFCSDKCWLKKTQGPVKKFEGELNKDIEDQKWNKIREEKKENINRAVAFKGAIDLISKEGKTEEEIFQLVERLTNRFEAILNK